MKAGEPGPHPVLIDPPDLSRWEPSCTGVPYVHELESGRPGPEVLVTALVHGNEYSGAIALDAFLASRIMPARGRVTTAFCNMQAYQRFDPGRPDDSRFVDEDLNRLWDRSRLEGPGGCSELRRARELLPFVERCTHLLDLHSMHESCAPLLVTGTLPRNIAFARQLRCPGQIIIDQGHADGVRMRDYQGRAGPDAARIALLLEAGQHWEPGSVTHAANALMRFLIQAGSLNHAGVPREWLLPDADATPAVEVTHPVVARSMDFAFLGRFSGGEVIGKAGTAIALDGGEPVVTPYDECVLVMPSLRQLRPGVTVVRLGAIVGEIGI
ncbi:MAG: succinylglutamate desuccinylase/aspartoacylase [Ramlibacter sp.]|nr:succinylglutamate desuccinylase/aspartoacylase [Ramlibacter sp.]